ncbi:nuclease-related domain-containing protein [Tenuibacillus multivorans]|uniref:Nuclease-related domain-containing protein n=1 Tax=Tenuibacillus multivorans TaxID=237069 RepID=A0A1G9X5H0_9BACI|nr:nuclease-related domain-containing protein [Tenuibacillus multivorans]GEL78644.1 hypothetical protein TMU01_28790 [Tenuibacillus multivorans]SDM91952.1 Nuclease-related domain-containing protein [Tenuibacillus multivorans]
MFQTQKIPSTLLKIIAYQIHLPSNHKSIQKIEADIAKSISGYYGEKSIAYYINSIVNKNFEPVQNIYLNIYGRFFEIDALLVNDKFLLITEVKNHRDVVTIDHELGVMVQQGRRGEKTYQDPILQAEKQAQLLDMWLKNNGYDIPIEILAVFTNQNVVVKRPENGKLDSRIIYGYKLNQKYEEISKKYTNHPVLNDRYELINKILDDTRLFNKSLLKNYNLKMNDFMPGVTCPNCDRIGMVREKHKWRCLGCHHTDKYAHIRALKEYFLIFGPEITNKKAREWLGIESRYVAKYLLQQIAHKQVGKGRQTVYILNFDLQKDFNYLLEYNKKQYIEKLAL